MWHLHYDDPHILWPVGLERLVITQYRTREHSAVPVFGCVQRGALHVTLWMRNSILNSFY